jgi:hypothetical protein
MITLPSEDGDSTEKHYIIGICEDVCQVNAGHIGRYANYSIQFINNQ